tara:strand:+ start:441 stop:809 length:369 start_codon:yes stop_codon:yes gene_type:complete
MGETIYIILGLVTLFSIGLNIFLIWYGRSVLQRMFFVSDHMTTLVEEVVAFHKHLNILHEMEVFYGDETIGGLITHSTGLIETLEDFEEIYTMFDTNEERLYEEINTDDTDSTDATATPPTP